jgi:hypothetical protein
MILPAGIASFLRKKDTRINSGLVLKNPDFAPKNVAAESRESGDFAPGKAVALPL